MKQTLGALTLTAVTVLWGSSSAFAQNSKVARGTVSAIAGQWLTVRVGNEEMKFSVDGKTSVIARGASTKSSRAAAAGKPGPHLNEVLSAGQAVAVTYNDMAGALHATEIKAISKAAAVSNASANAAMKSTGVVKSIGADWITISGRTGAATFDQTFKIAPSTKVFAKGAGTATAAKGGKVPFADVVKAGDHVSVSYQKQGDSLLASDVHVTMKTAMH
jgi:hypothetical protein